MKLNILTGLLLILQTNLLFGQNLNPYHGSSFIDSAYFYSEPQINGIDIFNQSNISKQYKNKTSTTFSRPVCINFDDNQYRVVFTYDLNGNMLTELEQLSTGYNITRSSQIYDSSGKLVQKLQEIWQNLHWVNLFRSTYTYDPQGHLFSAYYEKWFTDIWVMGEFYTYTYDERGNLISRLLQGYQNNEFVNIQRYSYTFDENNNKLSEERANWSNGDWEDYYHVQYTYDAQGVLLMDLTQEYLNSQWRNSYQHTYTFGLQGNMLTDIWQMWVNENWTNYANIQYTYDFQGNLLTEIWKKWQNNLWVNNILSNYTYENNNVIKAEGYVWYNNNWASSPVTFDFYYNNNRDVYTSSHSSKSCTIDYIQFTEVSEEINNQPTFELMQNYPNPFNPETKIRYNVKNNDFVSLRIYDILGKEVAVLVDNVQNEGKYEVTFNGTNLSSGIYFCKLKSGNLIKTKKMLLLK
ncbi:MAG: T9SS type A sorting domain-containing protein [bacterium]